MTEKYELRDICSRIIFSEALKDCEITGRCTELKSKNLLFAAGVLIIIAIIIGSGVAGRGTETAEPTLTSVYYAETAADTVTFKTETETAESAVISAKPTQSVTESPKLSVTGENAPFKLTMLDVNNGLSLLIEADGKYMMYDGGPRERSSYVVAYLRSHGVTEIDKMFVSHYDADHISGLIGVLNTTKVNTVVCPDYTADTKIYGSFMTKLAASGARTVHPSVGDSFTLGGAQIKVLGPAGTFYEDENSLSVAVKVTYGKFSCVITGDAEAEAEREMLSLGSQLDADLYVVGHHGSSSSSTAEFVRAMSPAYAFLSTGADNSYGHPTQKTLNTLKNNSVKLFRTDTQGEVTCLSDGEHYSFSKEPTDDRHAGKYKETTEAELVRGMAAFDAEPERGTPTGTDAKWVLNTNTKRIHYPYCSSVNQMKESNKGYSNDTVAELVSQGYKPCGNCHPTD